LGLPDASLDETFEELHVQCGGGIGFRLPLDADAEPVGINGLNGFDHAIRRQGAGAELVAYLTYSLVMIAVYADFSAAVDFV
jgi:hypothetical protein